MTFWGSMRRAALIATAAALLAGCDRPEPARPAPAPAPRPAPPPQVTAPAALTRADILSALAKAASDHAAGGKLDTALAGRTFAVRLPFGCFGPETAEAAKDGLAHWTWSKDRSSIRLSASPADWGRSPLLIPAGAEPPWDGVEGFWIARPWLMSDACPAAQPPPSTPSLPPPAAAPMTMGLAAILSPEGSRLGRREGEAYSFVVRGEGETPPTLPIGGYRLVLEGRIRTFPDGSPVRCTSDSPNRRPVCLAAVQLDVVAFEDANGARLSEWRPT